MTKLHYAEKPDAIHPYCKVRRDHTFDISTDIKKVDCRDCLHRYIREAKIFRPSEDVSQLIDNYFL